MKTVSIHDAKTNLSKYIAAAKDGKNVYIGGFGKAEVVLTKLSEADLNGLKARNFSMSKGLVVEKMDSFSEATDKIVQDLMYGD